MAIVRSTLKAGTEPTEEQLAEVRAATAAPHVYDPECPPLSKEELKQFRRVNQIRKDRRKADQLQIVSLRLRPETVEKARSIGKGYTSVLSQIIEEVFDDPSLIKRFTTH